MKNISKNIFLFAFAILATSCVNDDDFQIPPLRPVIFSEDFSQTDFNQDFDYEGWVNFAETGSKLWIEREFDDDGYIQFSSFNSGDASNIGWAITPAINLTNYSNVKFKFESATNFVDNADNKLEVLISTDFDGSDVLSATWNVLPAIVADETTNGYEYIPSGEIDLSNYNGVINIAFRVTGNGSTLDGLFQVDKVRVYSLN